PSVLPDRLDRRTQPNPTGRLCHPVRQFLVALSDPVVGAVPRIEGSLRLGDQNGDVVEVGGAGSLQAHPDRLALCAGPRNKVEELAQGLIPFGFYEGLALLVR